MGWDLTLEKVNVKITYNFSHFKKDYLDVDTLDRMNGKEAMDKILEVIRGIEDEFSNEFFNSNNASQRTMSQYPIYLVPLYQERAYCPREWIHLWDDISILGYHSVLCFAHAEFSLNIEHPEQHIMEVW